MNSHGPQATHEKASIFPLTIRAQRSASKVLGSLPEFARRSIAVGLSVLLVPMTTGVAFAQQAPAQQYQPFDGSQDPGQMPGDPANQNMAQPNAQYGNQYAGQQYGQQPYGNQPYANNDQYANNGDQYGGQSQYGQPQGQQYGQPQYGGPMAASQLDQLVAPIALFPDSLVAQILAAATYPAQIAEANQWRQSVNGEQADQIAAEIDSQNWDPSVKAIAAFPSVLSQMDRNRQWTTDLGNAYYNQPQDVMNSIQEMRGRAEAAGNLRSTPQQTVTEDNGEVEIAPANPEVVYVPTYNPWAVYGAPIGVYPGYYYAPAPGVYFGAGMALGFGLGVALGAFTHFGWGWGCWGANWGRGFVAYNHNTYFTHSTTVFNHGWGRPGGPGRGYGYNRGGSFAGNGFNRNGGRPGTPYGGGTFAGRGGVNRPGNFGGGIHTPGNGFNHSGTPYGGGTFANRGGVNRPGNFGGGIHTPGNGFNRPGNTVAYNHSMPNFPGGSVNRPGYGGNSFSRPGYGGNTRSGFAAPRAGAGYSGGSYGRSFSGGGSSFSRPGGNTYARSGGFSAPRASGGSFGGGSHYSAPHFSGGGGGHVSAPHFSGGGGGGHFGGGGGGHFGGGGGGGHFGGGGGHGGGGGGHHR